MSKYTLTFEKPLKDIENKILSLKNTSNKTGVDVSQQIVTLEKELRNKSLEIYKNLTRWERVQLARHPKRPNTLDYITVITDNFFELHGDRCFGDDPAIIDHNTFVNTSLEVKFYRDGNNTRFTNNLFVNTNSGGQTHNCWIRKTWYIPVTLMRGLEV